MKKLISITLLLANLFVASIYAAPMVLPNDGVNESEDGLSVTSPNLKRIKNPEKVKNILSGKTVKYTFDDAEHGKVDVTETFKANGYVYLANSAGHSAVGSWLVSEEGRLIITTMDAHWPDWKSGLFYDGENYYFRKGKYKLNIMD